MKLLRTLAVILAVTTIPVSAAEIVVPVSGVTEGGFGSLWQSDLTLHNAGLSSTEATITFVDAKGPRRASAVVVDPKETLIFRNVVGDELGITSGTGALVIETDELSAQKLSVSSRTYTTGPSGQLGQDVPSYRTNQFARTGETALLTGPVDVDSSRFNFGVFAAEDSTLELVLYRADGTVAADGSVDLEAMTQNQYNRGIETLFDVEPRDGDTVYARVESGAVVFYGSIVANDSNDPSFVPQHVTRENLSTVLLGVDIDENGEIDIADADGDGVLDQPIRIAYTGFPYTIDVIVVDPEGNEVSLSLLTDAVDIKLYGGNVLQIYPVASRRGTTSNILLRASDGALTTDFVLPVEFL